MTLGISGREEPNYNDQLLAEPGNNTVIQVMQYDVTNAQAYSLISALIKIAVD